MQTLLVNLTRFGDLIQTRPALVGLKDQGLDPVLVCLDNFASAARLMRDVDVAPFPGDAVLAALNRDWRKALGLVQGWSRTVAPGRKRRVLNLTPDVSARLLARLLAFTGTDLPDATGFSNPAVAGFSLDANGFGAGDSPWAAFLFFSSKTRGCSPFNLADLLWKAAKLPDIPRPMGLPKPSRDAMQEAKALLDAATDPDLAGANGFAALQLGASDHCRRWPVASFAELGSRLWAENKLAPLLLGSADESPLAARYLASGAPGADLTGRTTMEQLAAVLCHCRLLVTNDTGTMHLAAALGVDVVALFLATAQPWDTGPYAPGAICLEPDLDCHPCGFDSECLHAHKCRAHIPATTVLSLVQTRLDNSGPLAPQGLDTTGARVWETGIGGDHFMDLRALSDHETADRTQWLRLQRGLYRQFLDSLPLAKPHAMPVLSAQAHAQACAILDQSAKLLGLLGQQIALLARDPRQGVKNAFLASWQRLGDLWNASPLFNVLGLLWSAQSQECGQDIASITSHIARYADLVMAWRSRLGPDPGPMPAPAPGMEVE